MREKRWPSLLVAAVGSVVLLGTAGCDDDDGGDDKPPAPPTQDLELETLDPSEMPTLPEMEMPDPGLEVETEEAP